MAAQPKLKSRYEIKEILDQGGKGIVYRAYDTVIRRDVALKTICYLDDKNYCLFEIDSKPLSRIVLRNGKKGLTFKVPHSCEKQTTDTLQAYTAGNSITHRIFNSLAWVMLDELKFPGSDSQVGKFGMFVPGKDQVGLSHIAFKPI